MFTVADGTAKLSGRDNGVRESTLRRDQTVRSEDLKKRPSRNLGKVSTNRRNKRWRRSQQWPLVNGRGLHLSSSHWTSSSSSMCRKKKHSLFHWNTLTWPEPLIQSWTCCKDNVLTIIGVSMWIEVCQILGKVSQSSFYLKEKPPKGCLWSQGGLQKFKPTTRPDYMWPETWSSMSKAAQKKEKQQWAIKKPKLENARALRGVHFIDPGDGEFKETIKKTQVKSWRYKWRRPCLVSWGRRSVLTSRGEQTTKPKVPTKSKRQSMHASWRLMNPTESVLNLLYQKIMKITSRRKGPIRWVTTTWCTSLFLCLKRWKFRMWKQQWKKGWELPAWQMTKERIKKASFLKHTKTKRKSTSVHVWTFVISKNAELEPKYQKYKGRSCSEVTWWRTIQDLILCSQSKVRLRLRCQQQK